VVFKRALSVGVPLYKITKRQGMDRLMGGGYFEQSTAISGRRRICDELISRGGLIGLTT